MKYFCSLFLLTVLLISCDTEEETKKIQTFVFDKEHLLAPQQEKTLDSLFRAHEEKTTNEIALVTTADYGDDKTILFYANNFAQKMGLGKKEKNNGVLIVFSKAHHETRVHTGYGMEKILKDDIATKIIDSLMVPSFKEGKYYEGLFAGSKAIVNFLEWPENEIK